MKKVALSLLAFVLLGTGAFAEDAAPAPALKFSGYLNTGINADISTEVAPSYYLKANDEGKAGSTFKLVGTYNADTWGYKFRLRARPIDDPASGDQTSPLLNYAYGWYKPYDGVTVLAGKLSDSTFAGLDDEGDNAFQYLEGAQAIYTISGFSVSAAVSSVTGAANTSLISVYGAKYSLPKTFTVVAVAATTKGSTGKIDQVNATASLDAVEGLALAAGYNIYTLATTSTTLLDIIGSYAVTDKISVAATAYDHVDAKYFDITPKVTYALTDAFTVGVKVQFITADSTFVGDTSTATYTPAVIASYVVGGATTNAYVGYDVTAKTTKTYLDFIFSF